MIDFSGFYIVVWAILFFAWLGGAFLAYNRSKEENAIRNTIIVLVVGVVFAFLLAAVNPVRKSSPPNTSTLNLKINPDTIVLPDRITIESNPVESDLSDEQRAERLRERRESARLLREREFPIEEEDQQ